MKQPYIVTALKDQNPTRIKPYNIDSRRTIDSELTEKAINFIKKNIENNNPFFSFIPFTQPHLPTFPHPDFEGKTGYGHYADVISEIDFRSGQVLNAIEELGIKENTIVIWLSDNGPEEIEGHHGTSGYWRGNYFTALEGSLRVPAMIRWPGKIPEGLVTNEIIHMVDILPTIATIAGAEIPSDRIIDGLDQSDFLLGKQEKSNRDGFPAYNGDEMFAYKWGNWKMHLVELNSMFAAPQKLNMPTLYNLIEDPKEKYPIDQVDISGAWVFPVIFEKIVDFQKTLLVEPPIEMGTPDPYEPGK